MCDQVCTTSIVYTCSICLRGSYNFCLRSTNKERSCVLFCLCVYLPEQGYAGIEFGNVIIYLIEIDSFISEEWSTPTD